MGGGGLPIPMGKAGGGLGLIIVVVMALLFGGNVIGGGGSGDSGFSPGGFEPTPPAGSGAQPGSEEDTVFEFTKFVAKDAQDTWEKLFARSDRQYPRAPVVTFTGGTQTGCGAASARRGLSTARRTTRCTSTSRSSRSCRNVSGRRVTSPLPT